MQDDKVVADDDSGVEVASDEEDEPSTESEDTTATQGSVWSVWGVGVCVRASALVQWNPSIAASLGEQHFGRYIGVAFIEGLFWYTKTVHLGPGCLAVILQLAFIQWCP